MKKVVTLSFILLIASTVGKACTNFLVTRGASVDGSNFITYAADSHIRYGELYFTPAADWQEGSMRVIYDRSTNQPRGEVPQPGHTYKVIGYINEHQVALGETTFGGRTELIDPTGIIDYGSLMFLALERSTSAREAIKIMADLVEEYGYGSDGETFSISDANEVWYMEITGKGYTPVYDKKTGDTINADRGAVWVAIRIPDGYVSGHANAARITTFPLRDGKKSITDKDWKRLYNDDVEVIYKHDIIDFARRKGYFTGKDQAFDFSAAFAPVDFSAARICDMRVWAMFNEINDDMDQYLDYVTGKDLTAERLPLYVKPNRKISLSDMMSFMRNYFQGTEYDKSQDIGGDPFGSPYRWTPLYWEYEGKQYFHERTTVTQQTGFSFIAQSRNWLPDEIGGIIWFGVDDTNSTVYTPFYCSIDEVPVEFRQGNGDMLTYSDNAAFWVFNRLAHFKYLFYNRVIDDIIKVQNELENTYQKEVETIDKEALRLYDINPEEARVLLTEYSCNAGKNTVERWKELDNFLLVKYLDSNIKQEQDGNFIRNPWGYPVSPKQNGYPDSWKKKVIEDTGDRFLLK
ncbi:MAG TPA: C69 family dipeptidase [Bacteroidetes bacterium]|nr:C69 family dipeptidase [Candidatus Limimorpha avicola]